MKAILNRKAVSTALASVMLLSLVVAMTAGVYVLTTQSVNAVAPVSKAALEKGEEIASDFVEAIEEGGLGTRAITASGEYEYGEIADLRVSVQKSVVYVKDIPGYFRVILQNPTSKVIKIPTLNVSVTSPDGKKLEISQPEFKDVAVAERWGDANPIGFTPEQGGTHTVKVEIFTDGGSAGSFPSTLTVEEMSAGPGGYSYEWSDNFTSTSSSLDAFRYKAKRYYFTATGSDKSWAIALAPHSVLTESEFTPISMETDTSASLGGLYSDNYAAGIENQTLLLNGVTFKTFRNLAPSEKNLASGTLEHVLDDGEVDAYFSLADGKLTKQVWLDDPGIYETPELEIYLQRVGVPPSRQLTLLVNGEAVSTEVPEDFVKGLISFEFPRGHLKYGLNEFTLAGNEQCTAEATYAVGIDTDTWYGMSWQEVGGVKKGAGVTTREAT